MPSVAEILQATQYPVDAPIDLKSLPVPEDVKPLFEPVKVGRYQLKHRIVYAPLTRCRAFGTIPQPDAVIYYSQRATDGGLVIAEGTCIAPEAHGYPCTPGIDTQEHVEAWKPVVEAVKAKGSVFFCQLWHCGRASHPDFQPGEAAPLSSSALAISDKWPVYTPKGLKTYTTPRALEIEEIPGIVAQYATAAKNAIAAGFDGVEVHGANGYLIDQFLKDSINQRTDAYGGSIEHRCRFALEVVAAVVDAVGADRVGIRISPFTGFLDAVDSHPYALHTYLCEELNKFGLAYVHMVEPRVLGNDDLTGDLPDSLAPFRQAYKGTFISAGGFTRDTGAKALAAGEADLICYGRHYLANPDLPQRFLLNAPLNQYDRATFYSQASEGYLDYPFLDASVAHK